METLTERTRMSRRTGVQHKSAGPLTVTAIEKAVVAGGHDIAGREARKLEVTFKLNANGAKSVAVAGDFNGWNASKAPLEKNGDVWAAVMRLPRGRYEYRFVVDGKWISDPSAKESVANPFGERNSVLSL